METKTQSVPNQTTKRHTKKLPMKLVMTPSGYAAEKGSAKKKKLPPRLGGV
jgi:hypothetical protein